MSDNFSGRTYIWYVEPLDSATNATLARELPEEDALRALPVEGKVVNLWRVSSATLAMLKKSRKDQNLKFRTYNREGNGKIRLYPFR